MTDPYGLHSPMLPMEPSDTEQPSASSCCPASTCSRCGEPHDNWPDDKSGMLCQMCWEAHCSEEWWKWMVEIDKFYHENIETRQPIKGNDL